MVSEAELLAEIRDGRGWAADALYQLYERRMRAQAIRTLGRVDAEAVHDIVAESFTHFLEIVGRGRGEIVDVGKYLCAIVRSRAVDQYRARRRLVLMGDLDEAPVGSLAADADGDGRVGEHQWEWQVPEVDAQAEFDGAAAWAAFSRLRSPWRDILTSVVFSDESIGQIAERRGMTPQVLSSTLYRATEGLRQSWVVVHLSASAAPECAECIDSLGAFVRSALRERRRAQVVGHLRSCHDCAARLAAAVEADSELPHVRSRRRHGGAGPAAHGTAVDGTAVDGTAVDGTAVDGSSSHDSSDGG